MLEESIAKRLINCGNVIKYNVDGSKLSSFKSGGAIDNLVYPVDLNCLIQCSNILRENVIPFQVIGNGTNILISDKGIKKVLLRLTKLNDIKIEDDKIYCYCGALIHNITKKAVDNNLSGLEWAIGIPGTIGGAITMNAGAFNGEIADIIEYVDVIDNGVIKRMSNTDMRFCYRDSIVNHRDIIIIGAMLKLRKDGLNEINERLNDYIDKRNKTQPRQPSCGSVFKRKNNISAALYIDRLGLKGLTVGGASISEKHAGFIINTGNATTEDYIMLANSVQQKIFENFGLRYEMEVKYIGDDNDVIRRLSRPY